jgi:hypothetical protein
MYVQICCSKRRQNLGEILINPERLDIKIRKIATIHDIQIAVLKDLFNQGFGTVTLSLVKKVLKSKSIYLFLQLLPTQLGSHLCGVCIAEKINKYCFRHFVSEFSLQKYCMPRCVTRNVINFEIASDRKIAALSLSRQKKY